MENIKRHLISAGRVFASSFITVVIGTIASGQIEWTSAFLVSLLVAGINAGLKAVLDPSIPVTLGGTKR